MCEWGKKGKGRAEEEKREDERKLLEELGGMDEAVEWRKSKERKG